jgi:hypothetical protein
MCGPVFHAEISLGLDDDDRPLRSVREAPDETAAEEGARDSGRIAAVEGLRERFQGYPPPRS